MKKKRIYIPVEIKKRELDSLLLFSIFASKHNFSIVISTKQNLNSSLNYLREGIYLMKSIGKRNLQFIQNLKKQGHRVVCLDIEGSHYIHKEKLINRIFINNLKELDYFFCWGKNQLKDLLNLYPDQKKKLKVTGHPKVDILKSFFNEIYKNEASKIKKKHGKFILITTFFPVFNFFKRKNVNSHSQMLKHADYSGPNLSFLGKQLLLHQKKNFIHFQNLIKFLNKKFENINFIIRPHPGEDHNNWEKKAQKYSNIKVIYDDQSTCSWIMASDLMISCNCTTLLESYLMSKKSVNFLPYSNKLVEFELIKASSLNIYNKSKLYSLINNIKNNNLKASSKKYKDLFKKNIENFDKKNSSEIIIKYLQKLKIENKLRNKEITFDIIFKKKLKKLVYKFKKYFNINNDLQKLINQKAPEINKDEIIEKIEILNKGIGVDKLNIVEILPGVFEIYKKN